VYTPGPQGLSPGMKVSDALRGAGGVQPDTYLGEVLINRLLSDSTRIQLRARLQDTTGVVVNDFPLKEDELRSAAGEAYDRSYHPLGVARHLSVPADTLAPPELCGRNYGTGERRLGFAVYPFESHRGGRLPNLQTIDGEGVVAFVASMGWIADLPDAERLPLLDEVRSLVTVGEYRRPWETQVHWTRLTTSGPAAELRP